MYKPDCICIWRYAYADFDLANEMLTAIDWSTLLTSKDVNTSWLNWRSKFLQDMEACIPQAVLKARKNLPWLTKTVTQAMRKRNLMFNTAKKSNSPRDWKKYKCVRNRVVVMLRRNKRQYYHNLNEKLAYKRGGARPEKWPTGNAHICKMASNTNFIKACTYTLYMVLY